MNSQTGSNSGEAPAQAAGYVFQIRYALFRAIKRLVRDPTCSVGVENLDDVALESLGGPTELTQLKHTSDGEVEFTDSSPAVWRTIHNWATLIEQKKLDLPSLELILVTNASVSATGGVSKLGTDDASRDVAGALVDLKATAIGSTNKRTKSDRDAFLALEEVTQFALLRAIRIVPDAPSLHALGTEIEDLLHYACEASKLSEFRAELEGWWFDKVSTSLSAGKGAIVPLIELDARIAYLREKYKASLLQIDISEPTHHPDDLDDYRFVRQVRVLNVRDERIRNAQRDFLKASAQRSKWLREARIDPAELNTYDSTLEEQWSTKFAIAADELSATSTEEDKCKCGRELLAWAETQQNPLRGASAQFLTSGSYHSLADRILLGWHPDFKKLF